jgi:hypothetical protein
MAQRILKKAVFNPRNASAFRWYFLVSCELRACCFVIPMSLLGWS